MRRMRLSLEVHWIVGYMLRRCVNVDTKNRENDGDVQWFNVHTAFTASHLAFTLQTIQAEMLLLIQLLKQKSV